MHKDDVREKVCCAFSGQPSLNCVQWTRIKSAIRLDGLTLRSLNLFRHKPFKPTNSYYSEARTVTQTRQYWRIWLGWAIWILVVWPCRPLAAPSKSLMEKVTSKFQNDSIPTANRQGRRPRRFPTRQFYQWLVNVGTGGSSIHSTRFLIALFSLDTHHLFVKVDSLKSIHRIHLIGTCPSTTKQWSQTTGVTVTITHFSIITLYRNMAFRNDRISATFCQIIGSYWTTDAVFSQRKATSDDRGKFKFKLVNAI